MDAISDAEPERGPSCVLVSALVHAALFGTALLAPPGAEVVAIDELFAPSPPRVLAVVPALAETAPSWTEGRAASPRASGMTVPTRVESGTVHARGVQRDDPAASRARSLSILAALAGRLEASAGDAFVAGSALAGRSDVAPDLAGDGLDMIGVGRGAGSGGGTIGASLGLASGAPGFGATCDGDELEARTARMGRALAIASCAASNARGAVSGAGFSTRRPGRAGPDAIDGSPHRGFCGCGGDADVHGSLSREAIRRIVRSHEAEVRGCYQRTLATRPDLEGRVTVQWIIQPSGRVQSSLVDGERSDLRSREVEQCIAGAVSRWTFPSAFAPTIVSYPFVLGTDA